jgi:hypothetical protein
MSERRRLLVAAAKESSDIVGGGEYVDSTRVFAVDSLFVAALNTRIGAKSVNHQHAFPGRSAAKARSRASSTRYGVA